MDKVIVITGASDGIGAALAKKLSTTGAKLVLAARREGPLEEVARATGALAVVTDVTRRDQVQRLFDRAVATHGRVDVWVNNAGRGISKSVLELTDADVDEMMLVNVKSVLYGMQVVAPHFRERKSGQVVNVSSLLSRVPFAPQRSAYNAAKHAMNSLTANVRTELKAAAPDVHVTLVLPGVVATHFGNNALGGGVDSRTMPNAQPVEEVAQVIADAIATPVDEVYTRPEYAQTIAGYYATTKR
jgi:NADP-dependent 3-hydroxy acid dehydrogenase YdfG